MAADNKEVFDRGVYGRGVNEEDFLCRTTKTGFCAVQDIIEIYTPDETASDSKDANNLVDLIESGKMKGRREFSADSAQTFVNENICLVCPFAGSLKGT